MKCISRAIKLCLVLLTLGLPAWNVRAVTVSLQATADATITDQFPTTPQGSDTNFNVGTTGPNAGSKSRRALLKFNLSSVPSNAVVSSAALTLRVVKTPPTPTNGVYELRTVLATWSESQATWMARLTGTPWASTNGGGIGTDYSATISQTNFITGNGNYTWGSNATMVADVQGWVADPASNNGWVLISQLQGVNFSERTLDAREGATKPSLQVQYTVPATPPTLTALMPTNSDFQFTFDAESNRTYTVEWLGDLVDTNWSGLTNIGSLPSAQAVTVTDPMTETNRFYRVRTP